MKTEIELLQQALTILTDKRIGTWPYMEGSQIYDDLRKATDCINIVLERLGGRPLPITDEYEQDEEDESISYYYSGFTENL